MKTISILQSSLICCSQNNLTTNAFSLMPLRNILLTRAAYITVLRFTKELCDDTLCNNCINIEHFDVNPIHFASIGFILYFNYLFYEKEPVEKTIENKIISINEYKHIKQQISIVMLTCFIIFFKNVDIVL